MIGVEVNPGCYALHQVQDGWEIIAPSDDPYARACLSDSLVGVIGMASAKVVGQGAGAGCRQGRSTLRGS